MNPIPIFIISHNRLSVLKESLKSYCTHIGTPFQIVIHDNNSTFPPLIEFLKDLEKSGIPVYWHPQNPSLDQLSSVVATTVSDYLSQNPSPYYIVTDPDIALDCVEADILEYYAFLLDNLEDISVVGPMLRIDDIPDYYPHKDTVICRHREQFWQHRGLDLLWKQQKQNILPCQIDTTFGMYRSSFVFQRLNLGLRTYAPYAARHLDWYIDPDNLAEDQIYFTQNASREISHWSRNLDKPGDIWS